MDTETVTRDKASNAARANEQLQYKEFWKSLITRYPDAQGPFATHPPPSGLPSHWPKLQLSELNHNYSYILRRNHSTLDSTAPDEPRPYPRELEPPFIWPPETLRDWDPLSVESEPDEVEFQVLDTLIPPELPPFYLPRAPTTIHFTTRGSECESPLSTDETHIPFISVSRIPLFSSDPGLPDMAASEPEPILQPPADAAGRPSSDASSAGRPPSNASGRPQSGAAGRPLSATAGFFRPDAIERSQSGASQASKPVEPGQKGPSKPGSVRSSTGSQSRPPITVPPGVPKLAANLGPETIAHTARRPQSAGAGLSRSDAVGRPQSAAAGRSQSAAARRPASATTGLFRPDAAARPQSSTMGRPASAATGLFRSDAAGSIPSSAGRPQSGASQASKPGDSEQSGPSKPGSVRASDIGSRPSSAGSQPRLIIAGPTPAPGVPEVANLGPEPIPQPPADAAGRPSSNASARSNASGRSQSGAAGRPLSATAGFFRSDAIERSHSGSSQGSKSVDPGQSGLSKPGSVRSSAGSQSRTISVGGPASTANVLEVAANLGSEPITHPSADSAATPPSNAAGRPLSALSQAFQPVDPEQGGLSKPGSAQASDVGDRKSSAGSQTQSIAAGSGLAFAPAVPIVAKLGPEPIPYPPADTAGRPQSAVSSQSDTAGRPQSAVSSQSGAAGRPLSALSQTFQPVYPGQGGLSKPGSAQASDVGDRKSSAGSQTQSIAAGSGLAFAPAVPIVAKLGPEPIPYPPAATAGRPQSAVSSQSDTAGRPQSVVSSQSGAVGRPQSAAVRSQSDTTGRPPSAAAGLFQSGISQASNPVAGQSGPSKPGSVQTVGSRESSAGSQSRPIVAGGLASTPSIPEEAANLEPDPIPHPPADTAGRPQSVITSQSGAAGLFRSGISQASNPAAGQSDSSKPESVLTVDVGSRKSSAGSQSRSMIAGPAPAPGVPAVAAWESQVEPVFHAPADAAGRPQSGAARRPLSATTGPFQSNAIERSRSDASQAFNPVDPGQGNPSKPESVRSSAGSQSRPTTAIPVPVPDVPVVAAQLESQLILHPPEDATVERYPSITILRYQSNSGSSRSGVPQAPRAVYSGLDGASSDAGSDREAQGVPAVAAATLEPEPLLPVPADPAGRLQSGVLRTPEDIYLAQGVTRNPGLFEGVDLGGHRPPEAGSQAPPIAAGSPAFVPWRPGAQGAPAMAANLRPTPITHQRKFTGHSPLDPTERFPFDPAGPSLSVGVQRSQSGASKASEAVYSEQFDGGSKHPGPDRGDIPDILRPGYNPGPVRGDILDVRDIPDVLGPDYQPPPIAAVGPAPVSGSPEAQQPQPADTDRRNSFNPRRWLQSVRRLWNNTGKSGFVWMWLLPLAANICVWSTIFKIADCPLIDYWPYRVVTDILIPWGVHLTHGKGVDCYGHIFELTFFSIEILALKLTWDLLKALGVPTPKDIWGWGLMKTMQTVFSIMMAWRTFNYLSIYADLIWKAKISGVAIVTTIFGRRFLRWFQIKYCPDMFSWHRGMSYPLCATSAFEYYDNKAELIKLPMSQISLNNGFYTVMKSQPILWVGWEWYHILIIWIFWGGIYFYFFGMLSYSLKQLPKTLFRTVKNHEPQVLAFLILQILRLIFAFLPRFILNFPQLTLWLIQLPFRQVLTNKSRKTRMIWGALIFMTLLGAYEVYLVQVAIPPQREWEQGFYYVTFTVFMYGFWVCFIGACSFYWMRAWIKNVIYPGDADIAELQVFKHPQIDRLQYWLRYYDGFWRYDEIYKRERGYTPEYDRAFRLSTRYSKWLIYPARAAVWCWIAIYALDLAVPLVLLARGEPWSMSFSLEDLMWRIVFPAAVAYGVDEGFLQGKRERTSFEYILRMEID